MLRAFCEVGRIREACKRGKLDYDLHYYWLKTDESYAAAFEQARQISGDRMEDEVVRRGIDGFDHPVIYEGKITGSYKAYSDNLAMFFLKGLRPEKYRDNQSGITFTGPTQINITIKDQSQNLSIAAQDLVTPAEEKDDE
jgi:hypothetical protein